LNFSFAIDKYILTAHNKKQEVELLIIYTKLPIKSRGDRKIDTNCVCRNCYGWFWKFQWFQRKALSHRTSATYIVLASADAISAGNTISPIPCSANG